MNLRHVAAALSAAAIAVCATPAFAQTKPAEQPAAPTPKPTATASPTPTPTPGPAYSRMNWRAVGPAASGGRIAAVAGSATDANLYYVGTAGGGVWKTSNGGQSWNPVFEDQKVSAIGAVAIDP